MIRLVIPILLAAAAAAQTQAPPRVGVGVIERKLTLAQAIEAAIRNNLDIEIERTYVADAQQLLKAAHGAFDGIFHWAPTYESRTTPTGSLLLGADGRLQERFHNQNFGYTRKLPWHGTSLSAGFDNGRQSTTNPFSGLNPYTQSRFAFTVTQPLLRNRAVDRERGELRIRAKDIEISQMDLEVRVIDIVTRVEYAYWDLVAARQDVRVKADGVDWGREQLARNERMIASGTLARVELSAAQAELDRRLDTYYASIGVLTEAENNLKTLMAGNRQEDIWSDVLIPVEEVVVAPPEHEELASAMATALSRRPELKGLTLRRENNDVRKTIARDQLKPQLNLATTYASTGLAGSVSDVQNPFTQSSLATAARINQLSQLQGLPPLPPASFGGVPGSLLGGYGSTLSNLFGGNFQSFLVGMQFDWNPRDRAAQAGLEQTVIAERRIQYERTRREQGIGAEVRNAMQFIATARQRIAAAESSARAAKEKLDSETRLFQSGESTNFLVLTRQNEYTDSLRRVVVSKLDLNKAVARLEQALGTTLEAHQVTVR